MSASPAWRRLGQARCAGRPPRSRTQPSTSPAWSSWAARAAANWSMSCSNTAPGGVHHQVVVVANDHAHLSYLSLRTTELSSKDFPPLPSSAVSISTWPSRLARRSLSGSNGGVPQGCQRVSRVAWIGAEHLKVQEGSRRLLNRGGGELVSHHRLAGERRAGAEASAEEAGCAPESQARGSSGGFFGNAMMPFMLTALQLIDHVVWHAHRP